jgi:hypothetical protein
MVGAGRFELPTPGPPDRCANRAALRSEAFLQGELDIHAQPVETSGERPLILFLGRGQDLAASLDLVDQGA